MTILTRLCHESRDIYLHRELSKRYCVKLLKTLNSNYMRNELISFCCLFWILMLASFTFLFIYFLLIVLSNNCKWGIISRTLESCYVLNRSIFSHRLVLSSWTSTVIWCQCMMSSRWKRLQMHIWISICGMKQTSEDYSLRGWSPRIRNHPHSWCTSGAKVMLETHLWSSVLCWGHLSFGPNCNHC